MVASSYPINTDVWSKARNMKMTVVAHSDAGGHWLMSRGPFGKRFILYEPSASGIRALTPKERTETFELRA